MPEPKFGVIYSRLHQVIPPGEFAHKVEDMGFDAVWATEGLANQLQALDPIVAMAALAQGSQRLTVGSCVIISPLRNPAILAKEVASLDVLSGGRIVLGVGVGASSLSNPADFRVAGVDASERGARCSEGIEVMKKLWTGERVEHHGQFHRFDDIEMTPTPARKPHPPIWAGGNAEGVLKRAARLCDGFVPMAQGPEDWAAMWARIGAYASEYGRVPAAITPALHVYYCMAASRAEAGQIAERTLSNRYGMPVSLPHVDRYVFGTPEDCMETIAAYRAVGVTEFVLNTVRPVPEVVAEVEKFAELVLPRVR